MNPKQIFRVKIKERLKNLSEIEKKSLDKKIFENFVALGEYKNSKEIFTYVSFDKEVDTFEIIKYSLKLNKKVFAPVIIRETKNLKVGFISNLNDLEIGEFKILQPKEKNIVDKKNFDILIIPGIVFDRNGVRIGRGEGYFDRFLAEVYGKKIALAFSFQIVDKLPSNQHDIKMDMIVTEKEYILF